MSATPSPLTSVAIGAAVNPSAMYPAGAQVAKDAPVDRQYCQPESVVGYSTSVRPSPSQSSTVAPDSGAPTVVAIGEVNGVIAMDAAPVASRVVQALEPSAAGWEYM